MHYTGFYFPYPAGTLGAEISFAVAYLLVEKVRLRVMSRGNKTEMVLPMAGGLALALLVAIIHGYYIFGQAYV